MVWSRAGLRVCSQSQTILSSSVTGEVITRNTRSTRPEFEIACSTPGGKKMKSCLRTTWFFAGDLHQPFAFEHVVDLLLNLMLVPGDMRHRLIHRNPVIEMTRARGLRHHQRLRQRAAK